MIHKIIIKETDINWLELIEMAFKRKGWGKTHTLYICDSVSITCVMEEFNFSDNKARFIIKCIYPEDEYYERYYNWNYLEYHLNNFTIDNFKLLVLKKIKYILNEIINRRTKKKAEELFEPLKHYVINETLIEKYELSEDYNVIESISCDDIRETCLSEFKDKILELANEEYENKIESYCEKNRESIRDLEHLLNRIYKLIKEMVD